MREEELLRPVLIDPFDRGRRAVYADWLQERGDARGEFMALQLALAEPAPACDCKNGPGPFITWRDGLALGIPRDRALAVHDHTRRCAWTRFQLAGADVRQARQAREIDLLLTHGPRWFADFFRLLPDGPGRDEGTWYVHRHLMYGMLAQVVPSILQIHDSVEMPDLRSVFRRHPIVLVADGTPAGADDRRRRAYLSAEIVNACRLTAGLPALPPEVLRGLYYQRHEKHGDSV